MNIQQLQNVDQGILISMITELSEENKSLRRSLTNFFADTSIRTKEASTILFSDYIRRWLENGRQGWQLTTYEGYRNNVCKHIAPYFEQREIKLCDLNSEHIRQYYQDKSDTGLSGNSLLKHHNNLRKCLERAKKDGLIENNPADLAEKPTAHKYNSTYYTPQEIEQLLSYAQGSRIYLPILLAAFLGLRRSEVLGLKWDAINFDRETITIKRKVIRITENGVGIIKMQADLKNKASYRTLSLPKQLLMYLKFVKLIQKQNIRRNPEQYCRDYIGYVCLNDQGQLISPTNVSNTFAKLVKRNHLRYLRFHDLRHSCASILYTMSYDLKDIQDWLGHSSISTTANLYIHLSFREKIKLANHLNEAIHVKEIESQLSL